MEAMDYFSTHRLTQSCSLRSSSLVDICDSKGIIIHPYFWGLGIMIGRNTTFEDVELASGKF